MCKAIYATNKTVSASILRCKLWCDPMAIPCRETSVFVLFGQPGALVSRCAYRGRRILAERLRRGRTADRLVGKRLLNEAVEFLERVAQNGCAADPTRMGLLRPGEGASLVGGAPGWTSFAHSSTQSGSPLMRRSFNKCSNVRRVTRTTPHDGELLILYLTHRHPSCCRCPRRCNPSLVGLNLRLDVPTLCTCLPRP